ncbi:MAG: UDP-N-acetylmuramate dehydrogenase [Chthonomonadales bacterium]
MSKSEFLSQLPVEIRPKVEENVSLAAFTTLRVGGRAALYIACRNPDDLAAVAAAAHISGIQHLVLGGGSNVCISDEGIRGLVIHNLCDCIQIGEVTRVDAGFNLMRLFQMSAFQGLSGLEFAVGIPGSVGGALVSNAGAYRKNIKDLLVSVEVVEEGIRKTVTPDWMQFSYRDSRLRDPDAPPALIVATTLRLEPRAKADIIAEARDYQRQRISKQPWFPSAGSFFKNVTDFELAQRIEGLTDGMRANGVVPAGFLSDACGCRGLKVDGAEISERHGNFVINRGRATASSIYKLTRQVKQRVHERFGIELNEEVMLIGDFSRVATE